MTNPKTRWRSDLSKAEKAMKGAYLAMESAKRRTHQLEDRMRSTRYPSAKYSNLEKQLSASRRREIAAGDRFDAAQVRVERAKERSNPAQESIEAYEEFHGKQPDEMVTVTKQVHFHKHLAGAGELKGMVVISRNHKYKVSMSRFGGAILAFNERKNQLFVEGGDQSVNLEDFGITREPHEVETLGRVISLDYFTTKDHLGSEGGTATYRHKFRTTNELGRHIVVKIAEYPDLIYHVLDERLEFSGGSYKILREGIDL